MDFHVEVNTKAHVTSVDYFAVVISCKATVTSEEEAEKLLYRNGVRVLRRCGYGLGIGSIGNAISEELDDFNSWGYESFCKENEGVFTGEVSIKLRRSFKDSEEMQQAIEELFSILKREYLSMFEVSTIDAKRQYVHATFADIVKCSKDTDVECIVSQITGSITDIETAK